MYDLMFDRFVNSSTGRIIVSVIWGLGIAALFRRACKGRDCLIVKGPDPNQLRDKSFRFNDKCYRYTTYPVSCQAHGNIPV